MGYYRLLDGSVGVKPHNKLQMAHGAENGKIPVALQEVDVFNI